ncbi:MbcA/ParS/Xre antitoxin family protein [Fluviispira vulneris]|uniref:MbcA/ParS/Xre antitoxin family protein n=1 Tax=Fluviispira vulneris TaxID=2763012 RepID=UPI001C9840C0|nr:MbcA/ParS/Xre antitoxin family protein [Fluviispira vulneris]
MTQHLSDKKQKLSEEEVLGQAFWALVHHYGFTREQQAGLLGIPNYRQRLNKLDNEKIIPKDVDKKNRVGLLLGIHKNLRILFPYNREVVYGWMSKPQSALGGLVPIDFILEDPTYSYERMAIVRRRLDYMRCAV